MQSNFQKTLAGNFAGISKHAFWLMTINKDLAAHRHLLGEPAASIATPLAAAAHWFVAMLDAKAKASLPGNSVWTLYLGDLGVATAFGTPTERAALGGIALDACVGTPERTSQTPRGRRACRRPALT